MDQRIRGYLELLEKAPAEAPPLHEVVQALQEAGAFSDLLRVYENHLRRQPDDVQVLEAGARLLEEDLGDPDRAELWLKRLLEAAPEAAGTRDRLAQIYLRRRDERALCELYERDAARAPTPEEAASAYCALGEHLVALDLPARAVEMFQRAVRLLPERREALVRSREVLEQLGRLEAARAVIDREVELAPDEGREHAQRYVALGRRALEQPDRNSFARSCADAALAVDPDCHAARMLLEAIDALRAGWQEQVGDLLQRAQDEGDERAAARLHLQAAALHAAYDQESGAEQRVLAELDAAFRRWPAMPEALEFLERRHAALGDFEGLALALEGLVESAPDARARADLLLRLAILYELRFDEPGRAMDARVRAAAADPTRAEAVLPLCDQLEGEDRHAEAASLLEGHLAALPAAAGRTDLRLRIAELHLRQQGGGAAARGHLEAILAQDPTHARAAALLEPLLGAAPEALSRFLEERAAHTADPRARVDHLLRAANLRKEGATELLGRALLVAPERADVLAALEAAPDAQPGALISILTSAAEVTTDAEVRSRLLVRVARLLEAQGHRDAEALQAWRQVQELLPADVEAGAAVGRLLQASANAEELVRELTTSLAATDAASEQSVLLHEIATVWERHAPARAVEPLQQLAQMLPDDVGVMRRLAAALDAAGRWNERLQILDTLVETGDLEALCARATLLIERLAQPERGAADWLRALEAGAEAAIDPLERLLHAGIQVHPIADALAPRFSEAGAFKRLEALLQVRIAATNDPAALHDLHLELANVREAHLGDLPGAFAALGAALCHAADDLDLLARMAQMARALDAETEFAAWVREAWDGAPTEAALTLARHVATHADDPEVSRSAWRRVLALDPTDDAALAALAEAAAEAGHWAEAGSLLERRIAQAPQERRAGLGLVRARWLARQGAHGHAVEAFRAALAAGADEAKVLPSLAAALGSAGRHDELIEVLSRQVELARIDGREEEASRLEMRQAQLLEALHRRGEAARHWEQILARDPDDRDALEAVEALLEDEETAPGAARILDPIYERRAAWQKLRRVIEIRVADSTDPAFRVAQLRRLAQLAGRQLRDPALAFDAFARAFRDAPTDALLRSEMRVAAGQADRLRELAQVMAETAERLHVGGPGVQAVAIERELAELYEKRLGDPAAAAQRHQRILAFEPDSVEALRALHRLLPQAGAWRDQWETCARLAGLVRDLVEQAQLWREAARIASEQLDDSTLELEALEQLAAIRPDDREVLLGIERLAAAADDWDRVARALEGLARGDAEAACRLAALRRDRLGDTAGAVALYGQVLATAPAHEAARTALMDLARGGDELAESAAATLDAALAAAGDVDARVELREARIDATSDPELRQRLHGELIALHEKDLDSAALAFVAAARAFAEFPAFADDLERLAEATGSWEELIDVFEESEAPGLHRRIALVRERELGDHAGAAAAWNAHLGEAPDDVEALDALIRLHGEAQESEALIGALQRRAELAEGQERAELLMQAADVVALALQDPDRAVPLCRAALEAAPDHLPALEMLALHLDEDEAADELASLLDRIASLHPEASEARAEATLRRASLLAGVGAFDEAVRCCAAVLQERPGDPHAIALLENFAAAGITAAAATLEPIYRDRGDTDRLLDALERRLAEARGEERAAVLAEMVQLRLNAGEVEAAWPLALARFAAAPGDLDAVEAAASLAARVDGQEAWADAIENALVGRPDDRSLLVRLAHLYEATLGKAQEARATWERILDFDSADVEALRAVLRLAGASDPAAARDVALRLADLLPEEAIELLHQAAGFAEAQGEVEAALGDLRRILSLAPDDARAFADAERLLGGVGRYEELADLLRERETDPAVALRLAALLREHLGDVEGALQRYGAHVNSEPARADLEDWIRSGGPGAEEALRVLDPALDDVATRVDLRLALARSGGEPRRMLAEIVSLREEAGDLAGAFEAAAEAFLLDAEEGATLSEAARLAEAAGAFADLARTLHQALGLVDDLGPAAERIRRLLAPLLSDRLGDGVGAAAIWERLAADHPEEVAILDRLETIYRSTHDAASLGSVLERKIGHEADATRRVELLRELAALREEQLGDVAAAMDACRELLALAPADEEAFERLARLLEGAGLHEELATRIDGRLEAGHVEGEDAASDLRLRLAQVLSVLGEHRRAAEQHRLVLEIRPRDPAALQGLDAIAALETDPARAFAAELLAPIFAEEREWRRHVQMLEILAAAADLPAERARYHREAAAIWAGELEQPEVAFLAAGRALEADPDEEANLEACLRTAEAAGDLEDELIALLEGAEAMARTDEGRARLLRAAARQQETVGEAEAARATWGRVHTLAPDDMEALEQLARLHGAAGDVEGQLGALRALLAREETQERRRDLLLEIATVLEERQRDLPGATEALHRLLEIAPHDVEALSRLDTLCVVQERWIDLSEVLARQVEAAQQRRDDESRIEFLFRLAEVRERRLLDGRGALGLWAEILELRPDHGPTLERLDARLAEPAEDLEVLDLLERAYRQQGDPARLADLLEARVAATPDPEARRAVLLELGELRTRGQSRPDLAFLAFARAYREAPAARDGWRRLWEVASAAEAADEWLGLHEEAVEALAPDDLAALALHVAPICERDLRELDAAATWYERAGDRREALIALERLHRAAGRWEKLARTLDGLVEHEESEKERVGLLFRLGRLYEERLEDPERAVEAYRRLLQIDARHLPTLRALEPLYEAAGDRASLYEVLAAQREMTPEGSAWARLALRMAEVAEEALGDDERAATHYREVLARDPRSEAASRPLERLLERNEKWTELAELLHARLQATVDAREIATIHERLGRLQAERLEDGDAAVRSYQAVLEREPRNRKALEALRGLHAARGEGEALVAILRRLVPLQDDAAGVKSVRLELAEALAAAGKREEAIENGKRVIDLSPHDLLQLQQVELLFRDLEAWPEVIRAMELQAPFLEEAGDDDGLVELWRGVARIWVEELQRKEGAAIALEKILERRLDAEAFDELRSIYRAVADWRRWTQVTERYAAGVVDPTTRVELLLELAEVHETRLGQREIAFAKLGATFELAPDHAPIRSRLAALAEAGGMHEELALIYESVIDGCEDEAVAAELLLEEAQLQDEKLDDPDAAEACLRRILESAPEHEQALAALDGLFARRGRDEARISILERQIDTAADLETRRTLLLQQARVAADKLGDIDGAVRSLERALALDPVHAETREALAALLRQHGRLQELASLLARARDLTSSDEERYDLQVRLATTLEADLGDDDQARSAWALAHEIAPTRIEPLDALERIHTRHDRWAELVRVFDRKLEIVEEAEERVRLRLKLAGIHEKELGNLHDAIESLEQARADVRRNRLVLRELARLLRASEAWERLAGVIEEHLDMLGTESEAAEERVGLLVQLGDLRRDELADPDAAEAAWRQALAVDENALGAIASLGRYLEERGRLDEALDLLGREAALLGQGPDACDVQVRIARIHAVRGEVDEAVVVCEQALAWDESHLPALRTLRELHEGRGDEDASLSVLAREAQHAETAEERTRLWNEVGSRHLARDERESALRAFEEARRHGPRDLRANEALGELYYAQGEWAKAEGALEVTCAELAALADPAGISTLAHHLYRLGAACEQQDKKARALQAYTRAWESDPGLLPAGEGLARLLVQTGDDPQALRVQQAILLHHRDELTDPEVVELHHSIGAIRRRLGEDEAALKSFRAALELDRWHVEAHRAIIETAESLDDLALSIEHRTRLAEILEGDEKHALLVETAALAADRLGDPWQAIDACAAALRIRPDDFDTAWRLADLYCQTRQEARAIEQLQKLLQEPSTGENAEQSIRCHLRLGALWRDLPGGDEEALQQALLHYNAALDLDWKQTAAFEAVEAMLVGRQAWRLLETNYVRMLERLPREEASRPMRVLLYRTLAGLYLDALGDRSAAADAWRAVTLLAPQDAEAATRWAELVTDRPGGELESIDAWRKVLPVSEDPTAAARQLERLHARRRNYDASFVAATVVADLLGKGGPDEEGIIGRLRPFARNQAQGALGKEHWLALAHPGAQGPVARIFGLIHEHAGPLLAADFDQVPVQGSVLRIDTRKDRVDSSSLLYLAGAFEKMAKTLGLEAPALYKVAGVAGIVAANTFPVCVVAGEEMFGEPGSRRQLAWMIGRSLAATRHELAPGLFHQEEHLEVLLQAAVLLGEPRFKRTADAEQVQRARAKLARALPAPVQQVLQKIAYGYARDRNRQTVRAYLEAAVCTADRVGALLAGDLSVARHQIAGEPSPILDGNARVRDLANFALSDAYTDLRKALGMAVEVPVEG